GFVSLWRISRAECVLAAVAVAGVIVLGVLYGILIAVALSIGVALAHIARPHDAVLGDMPDIDGWVDVDEYPAAVTSPGLVVFRFDAPLFFVNAERFSDRVVHVLADNPGDEEWFVMDCEGIGALDASAVEMLTDLFARLREGGLEVIAVARANELVLDRLRRAALLQPQGSVRVYPTINSAVRAFHTREPRAT
ncbi:MAG: STAS domain-containing protein, partial [Actinomycetota bacterium]|nr:STAS domain-containing protein [Actinomycetota bacterium]